MQLSLLHEYEGCDDMSVSLNTLITRSQTKEMTIVAGKNGINAPVTWAHIVETSEAAKFLFKDEIAFLTGLGLTDEYTLLDLITDIYDASASAVVVNIGLYIKELPTSCCNFCDEHSLTLITVPWHIHLSVIIKEFCFYITKAEQKDTIVSSAFKNAIHFPSEEELYVVPLSEYGYGTEYSYSAVIIKYDSEKMHSISANSFTEKIRNSLSHEYPHSTAFLNDDSVVVIANDINEKQLREFSAKIKTKSEEIIGKTSFYIGVGRLTKSLRCLHKSYKQAKQIIHLSEKRKDNDLYFYSDMGMYRLLIGIEDEGIITDYLNQTLLPLARYDKEKDSNIMDVLFTYLSHNGSVKETSEELFIHRNTTLYKIHKAEEILHMDLSLLDTRTQLILAFALYKMSK